MENNTNNVNYSKDNFCFYDETKQDFIKILKTFDKHEVFLQNKQWVNNEWIKIHTYPLTIIEDIVLQVIDEIQKGFLPKNNITFIMEMFGDYLSNNSKKALKQLL